LRISQTSEEKKSEADNNTRIAEQLNSLSNMLNESKVLDLRVKKEEGQISLNDHIVSYFNKKIENLEGDKEKYDSNQTKGILKFI
jgi:hypothetical protein